MQPRYANDLPLTGWEDGEDQVKSALLSLDDELSTASTAVTAATAKNQG